MILHRSLVDDYGINLKRTLGLDVSRRYLNNTRKYIAQTNV